MHMLHVTLGVIYLGVVALRRKFIPILLVLWLVAWLGTPRIAHSIRRACPFNRRDCVRDYPVVEAKSLRFVRRGSCRFVLALRGPGVDVHLSLGLSDVGKDSLGASGIWIQLK